MLDMFVFWLSYAGLYLFWWTGITLLLIEIVDKYLDIISEGDLKGVLTNKVDSLLDNIHHGLESRNNLLCGSLWVGVMSTVIIYIRFYFVEGASTLHEITIKIATFISETATTPIIIVLGLIALHKTIKGLYKLGKKVKPLVDKLNKENG